MIAGRGGPHMGSPLGVRGAHTRAHGGPHRAGRHVPTSFTVQQTLTIWKASLVRSPPKKRSSRTSMPTVLNAGPPVTSTVAGLKGTDACVEPRVATVAHLTSERFVTITYLPVSAR